MKTQQFRSNLVALSLVGGIIVIPLQQASAQTTPAVPPTVANGAPITITVAAGERQTFGGFGASVGNWGGTYQTLSVAERTELSRLLWHDLKFNTLRMWFDTDRYAPTRGAHDLSDFRRMYVDSSLISDARKQGVTTLLLAPEHLPDYMKGPMADGKAPLKEEEVANYAVMVADFIERLKKETGVEIDVTGIQNEPNVNEIFSEAQLVSIVKQLRSELDKRGLQNVKIIASEHASVDGLFYKQLDALKADPTAWKDIVGIASHSYNMAATAQAAQYIATPDGRSAKEYWMTEASDNGSETPGNNARAISLSARFLNDMNHRVTRWVHFLGFENDDAKDNATRIIAYSAKPYKATVFQKFYSYQQLANTFDVGATFRASQSSIEGDMAWTYGKKPRILSASAKNPDGSWGIGISNFTADSFLGVQGWADDDWNSSQGGNTPGQTFPVTIRIEELKNAGNVPFVTHRTGGTSQNAKGETLTMKNGALTINVAPLELVTLRSNIR
ncbi:hypothetical protein EON83_12785 [bacterium]|nr:MAG: hypothetical protein EON83_12785 [bacterium]